MSSSSSVDRAPTMCSEDPGFDFCRGITLVSCWSIHLPVFRGTSCFLFFFRKVKIIEKTCQADPRSSVKSYTRTLLRFCRIRTCKYPFYKYQQRSKAGRTHGDLNKNVAYKKSIKQSINNIQFLNSFVTARAENISVYPSERLSFVQNKAF